MGIIDRIGHLAASARQPATPSSPERAAAFPRLAAVSPLPLLADDDPLPGGMALFEYEFVVGEQHGILGADAITLTTQRLAWSSRLRGTTAAAVYLADLADVQVDAPMMGPGSATVVDHAGVRSHLPAILADVRLFRSTLLQMMEFARQQARVTPYAQVDGGTLPLTPTNGPVHQPPAVADPAIELESLGRLLKEGMVTQAEFDAKKTEILGRF